MICPEDYAELKKIAGSYLSDGKTILEIGTGDNTGIFYALSPLVYPEGLYAGVDPLYTEEIFGEMIIEDYKQAVNLGLVDETFSPNQVNLKYLPVDGQDKNLPEFDLAICNELTGYLIYAEEMESILKNLSRKKKSEAGFIIFEHLLPNGASDIDSKESGGMSIREICKQYLSHVEEGKTSENYEYLIGELV